MKKEKNTPVKKTSTKKTTTKKSDSVDTKESKVQTKTLKIYSLTEIRERISSLEDAYVNAISGKIKFGEVKDIFKKLHKEIKTATKN